MASISQAQAMFLQAGGLETLGVSKSVTYSVKVKKENKAITFQGNFVGLGIMESMLAQYIGEFLTRAADNLNENNSISTGDLERSLSFEVVQLARGYKVNFLANDYYKFVDEGVRGVGSKNINQTSPYKFRYINPSKSHVEAIKKWIVDNNLTAQVTDITKWGTYGEREVKGKNMPLKSAAWLVARLIKKKGLKRTAFWTDAFNETFANFGAEMSKALGQSITINLEQMAKEIKSKKGTTIPRI